MVLGGVVARFYGFPPTRLFSSRILSGLEIGGPWQPSFRPLAGLVVPRGSERAGLPSSVFDPNWRGRAGPFPSKVTRGSGWPRAGMTVSASYTRRAAASGYLPWLPGTTEGSVIRLEICQLGLCYGGCRSARAIPHVITRKNGHCIDDARAPSDACLQVRALRVQSRIVDAFCHRYLTLDLPC